MRIKVQQGQNLFDIVLQYYGSIDGIKDLKQRNPKLIISYDQELEAGLELNIGDPLDEEVVKLYNDRKIAPATGIEYPNEEGIQGIYADEYDDEYA